MAVRNFLKFFVTLVLLCKSVKSLNDTISSVEPFNAGFGFELVQERLDRLQFSFLELFVHVKELGEAVLNNQRTIEQGQMQSNQLFYRHQKQITDRVEGLESGVLANVSLITNYSKKILDLQTVCANHDSIKEELYKLKNNISYSFEHPNLQTNKLITIESCKTANSTLSGLFKMALENISNQFKEELYKFKNNTSYSFENPNLQTNNLITIESCKTVKSTISGLFKMAIENIPDSVTVFCEMQRFGGGWMVFQQRFDGSVDFFRKWNEYKAGFGDVGQEFWLGLEAIYQITKQGTHELMVELEDFKGNYSYARFSEFAVGSEAEKYALKKLGSYSGTAGDYLSHHKGMKFTTQDSDNDVYSTNCALKYEGAWWYKSCHQSHLNGRFLNESTWKAINWFDSPNGLKFSRMMIQRT